MIVLLGSRFRYPQGNPLILGDIHGELRSDGAVLWGRSTAGRERERDRPHSQGQQHCRWLGRHRCLRQHYGGMPVRTTQQLLGMQSGLHSYFSWIFWLTAEIFFPNDSFDGLLF